MPDKQIITYNQNIQRLGEEAGQHHRQHWDTHKQAAINISKGAGNNVVDLLNSDHLSLNEKDEIKNLIFKNKALKQKYQTLLVLKAYQSVQI